MSSLYDVLGLKKDATEQDIKVAYKKLAMKYHPDRGGEEDKFKEVGRAYDILSNEEKRDIYDRLGEEGIENIDQVNNAPNPHDIFQQFFNRQPSDNTTKIQPLKVSLKDIYLQSKVEYNYNKKIDCDKCGGTGGIDKDVDYTCKDCGGKGIKIVERQIGPGMFQRIQVKCNTCDGKGKVIPVDKLCPKCKGEGYIYEETVHTIELNNNMRTNTQVRVNKDLVLVIQEERHPHFQRMGNNLIYEKKITLAESLCGTKFIIEFINDKPLLVRSKIVIDPIKTYKLVGWGMDKHSDLFIKFNVVFPNKNDIKPEFKKHIKKYLNHVEEELDTTGVKSSTLIEVEDEEEDEGPMPEFQQAAGGAQCHHQ